MAEKGEFDWEHIYKEIPLEKMGWYHDGLDPDLAQYLAKKKVSSGTFLDLGSGSGNQSNELTKKGFKVTGSDIAESAVKKSSALYDQVEFIQDDIVHSNLNREFDYIFDRGCFHCIAKEKRAVYIQAISKLLKSSGKLFLKCFGDNPHIDGGPFQFTEEEIVDYFQAIFEIIQVSKTEYQGTLKENPKALFFAMRKRQTEI